MLKDIKYYTYMLRCEDNSIYTGITTDLNRRFYEHINKTEKCAKYTLKHQVTKIEIAWESDSRKLACKLEYYIKKNTKMNKEKIIEKNNLDIISNKIDTKEYRQVDLKKSINKTIISNCF